MNTEEKSSTPLVWNVRGWIERISIHRIYRIDWFKKKKIGTLKIGVGLSLKGQLRSQRSNQLAFLYLMGCQVHNLSLALKDSRAH